ncbi:MAG: TraB/GumN family protein [Lysobacter sp.]
MPIESLRNLSGTLLAAVKVLLAGLFAVSSVASAALVRDHAVPELRPLHEAGSEIAVYEPPVPLLWKVSDADNAVYLLGSFHLLKADDYPVSPDIDAAFADAERLVFEIAPEDLADPATGRKFLEAAKFPDGRTLPDALDPRLREKLHRLLARQGTSISQVEHYSPWYVNLSLMLGLSQSLGFSAEQGLDRYLMQQAAEAGKPMSGLESIEDQLQALVASPMEEQVKGLEDFIDRPHEVPAELSGLHQAWRDGDLVKLDQMTRREMLEKTPQTYQVINVERNQAWLPQLRQMLDGQRRVDFLVVVGALHLLGEDGLIEKLRLHGYQVERICSVCEAEADSESDLDATSPGSGHTEKADRHHQP